MWDLFYRHTRLLMLTILLIVVAGLAAYHTLPRQEDPTLTPRVGKILTRFPGASAERVETLVTEKIEDELQDVEGIDEISSTSRAGISIVFVTLKDAIVDVDEVWSRLRDRLDDALTVLPPGASAPEFDALKVDAYTLIAALTWEGQEPVPYAILQRLSAQLEDQPRALPGTQRTQRFGHPQEEIRVDVHPPQLAALGLTSADVARAIARGDAKVAAGQLRHAQHNLLIDVQGALHSLQDVRRTPIRRGAQGQVVQLGDIAAVTKTIADPPSELVIIDGKPGVVVAVRMEAAHRIDRWAQSARQTLHNFRRQLPQDIGLALIFDQSRYVETRLHKLQLNLLLGASLVVLVMWLMMGWKSAFLVGLALPLSSLMVLAGMRLFGVAMHQMSVTGLIIALGMLIDNAIIVVHDVRARLRQHQDAARATAESVRHLWVPLLGSTLTTVCAFMPLVLMPGSAGEFVGTIGLSVILALFSSLLIALTVVAALTGRLHHPRDIAPAASWWRTGLSHPRLTQAYGRTLASILSRPALGIGVAVILPILGFYCSLQLEEQFFPPSDRDQFQIQFHLPSEASLQQTRAYIRDASDVLRQYPQVAHVHWFVGGNAPKFYYNMLDGQRGAAFFAQALVQLRAAKDVTEFIRRLQEDMDQRFPSAQLIVKQLEQGPAFAAPIEIHLYGPDLIRLRQLGTRLRAELAEVPDVVHTRATLSDGQPKLWLQLDAEETRLAGLDNVGVAEQLQQTLEGVVGGSLIEATEELPVRVRLAREQRGELATITTLDLLPPSPDARARLNGPSIPVRALGTLGLVPEVGNISHLNGERVNTIQGFTTAGVLPSRVLAQFHARLQASQFELLPGYRYTIGGESDERNTAVSNLLASVGVLMVLMAATLVLAFNSFCIAGIIAAVAMLSTGVAFGSLWLFGYPFGFMAIVGTMGLVGVGVNDAIVVLAALREHPQARRGDIEAVKIVVVRATRHVLATSVTTMAGFAPLLLAGGGFWPPVAVTIAGGVVGATLL